MRRLISIALVVVFSSAHATEVRLAIYKANTKRSTFHVIDVQKGTIKTSEATATADLPVTNKYRVRDRHVETVSGDAVGAEADNILCQATVDGVDVLVVRHWYNSFSTPLRWLAAFSGHPDQLDEIVLLFVREGTVKKTIEVRREPSSYEWSAKLSEASPSKP